MEQMMIIPIIGLIVIGIVGYFLYVNYRRYNLIKTTETSPISVAYSGFYEVKGRIVPQGNQIISPFSEKECVYYHFTVEQKKSSGKSSHWVKIIDDKQFVNFGIDDNTGVAMIDR